MHTKSLGVKAKLALVSTALFLLMLGVVTAMQVSQLRSELTQVLSDQQFSLATTQAAAIDDKFSRRQIALVSAAHLLSTRNLRDVSEAQESLAERAALRTLFDEVYLFSAEGILLADVPTLPERNGLNVADRAYFKLTVATLGPVISEPVRGKVTGAPLVILAAPVIDSKGRLVAVLAGSINLSSSNFLDQISEAKLGKSGYFYLLTRGEKPILVSHPDKKKVMTPVTDTIANSIIANALLGFDGTAEGKVGSVRGLFSFKALKKVDWIIGAVLPVDEAFAPIVSVQKRVIWAAVAAALLMVPLVWLFAFRLMAPLGALRDNILRLISHSTEEELPVRRQDEIGELTQAFNRLMRERRTAEQAVHDSERLLRTIADNMPTVVAYIDRDERFVFINSTFETWWGRPRAETLGKTLLEVFGAAEYARIAKYVKTVLAGQPVFHERETVLNGLPGFIHATYLPQRSDTGEVLGFYVSVSDISLRKEIETDLAHRANHDTLTGLPNRALFQDRLGEAIKRSARHGAPFALMYLDVDHFKRINDTHGHAAGDLVLKSFARRLTAALRGTDTVARLGGDEFTIILEGLHRPHEAESVATKILAATQPEVLLDDGTVIRFTASIGIAYITGSERTMATAIEQADNALYRAKANGRNTYVLIEGPMALQYESA